MTATSSLADYEAAYLAAVEGRQVARDHYVTHQQDDTLTIIDEWTEELTEAATGFAVAVHTMRDHLPPDEFTRLRGVLDSTVEGHKAWRSLLDILTPEDMDAITDGWDDPVDVDAHFVAWERLLSGDVEDVQWLVEPIIAAGRGHAVYAKAGEGKSWTVLAAVLAHVTGKPFLTQPAGPPHHVLYLDYEMTEDDLRDRVEGFGYGLDDDLTPLHYALIPSFPPLDTDKGGQRVTELAVQLGVTLVVIDTTGRALKGEENSSDTIKDFYRHTGQPLKAAGIAMVRLDHAGKDLDRGQRGTSGKNDDVDIVWQIVRTDSGQRWTATKRRVTWAPPEVTIAVEEGTDGVWRFTTDKAGYPAGTAEVARLLDDLGVPLDWGRPRIKREHGKAVTARATVLSAAIKYRRERAETDTPPGIELPPEDTGTGPGTGTT